MESNHTKVELATEELAQMNKNFTENVCSVLKSIEEADIPFTGKCAATVFFYREANRFLEQAMETLEVFITETKTTGFRDAMMAPRKTEEELREKSSDPYLEVVLPDDEYDAMMLGKNQNNFS